jgi:hypothetical protein
VDAKSYVLVSKLDPEVYSKYVEDKERAHVPGFAFVVISIVQVAGGKITEGWDHVSFTSHSLEVLPFYGSEFCQSRFRGPLASAETAGLK